MNLKNKNILITGATGGIGSCCARLFNNFGANCIICGRNKNKLENLSQQLNNCSYFCGDITDNSYINNLVEKSGKIDGLLYCHGISEITPIKLVDDNLIDNIFNVNFKPFLKLMKYYSYKKYNNGSLSIVIISSISALKGFIAKSVYSASKLALISVMRTLCVELHDKNIRINSICPSMVQTNMINNEIVNTYKNSNNSCYKYGLCEPIDVANCCAFLLSDLSRYINGTVIPIDNGIMCGL